MSPFLSIKYVFVEYIGANKIWSETYDISEWEVLLKINWGIAEVEKILRHNKKILRLKKNL